ncbi:tetratricopeptide repeat protein [Planctomycetota bacterium]
MAQRGSQHAIWRLAAMALAAVCVAGCGQGEMDNADALMAQGKHADAIQVWQGMLAAKPDDSTIITRIATAQARMGRLDDAEATLVQAIPRAPTDADLRQNLALVYLKQKRFDDALAAFQGVLDLQPSYPNTHYYIGLIHEMRGDETTAKRLYIDEVNKGASLGAWNRIWKLNKKNPRPRPKSHAILTFSGVLLAVAAAAYGLRLYLDSRQQRELLSPYGAD